MLQPLPSLFVIIGAPAKENDPNAHDQHGGEENAKCCHRPAKGKQLGGSVMLLVCQVGSLPMLFLACFDPMPVSSFLRVRS